MEVKNFKDRFQEALNSRDKRPVDLSKATGISQATISQYISGYSEPKKKRLAIIADYLNVNPSWLLGLDVPMERTNHALATENFDNLYPIELKKFPLLGEVACGEPIFAVEDRETYVMAGTDIKADFCLKAKGDSMINARIHDGDIVFIRKQDTVENGEIAAVIIDDEVMLKRLYVYATGVQLLSENPKYPPKIYSGEQLDHVRILGKAIAFQSDVI